MVAGTLTSQTAARAAVARRMGASKQQVPHFYVQTEVAVDALRAATANAAALDPPTRVTLSAGLVSACSRALVACPEFNSVWTPEGLLQASEVNVAVAIALEGALVAPVILGADRLDLRELALALEDLRVRAETGKLRPAELTEGTFTLSNLGMTVVTAFGAIVVQPQVAILATGRAVERCVVADGELARATVMTVTLSADHRAVDGIDAARFLETFKQAVELPALTPETTRSTSDA